MCRKRYRNGLSMVLAALLTAVAACGGDATGNDPVDPGPAPPLPPLASMEADLSYFDGGGAAASTGPLPVAGPHFLTAAFAVGVARAATVITMAVPVATFAAAAGSTPVHEDGAFHWRYAVSHQTTSFQADLSGVPSGDRVSWEMRLTTTGTNPPLDDFLWYSGESILRAGGGAWATGEWHIFDGGQPTSGTELLQVDWTHPDDDTWTLTFTNVNPAGETTNDRLEYEASGDLRVVRHVDVSESTTSVISWNEVTGEGYLEGPGYNNGQRACWDSELANTPCS